MPWKNQSMILDESLDWLGWRLGWAWMGAWMGAWVDLGRALAGLAVYAKKRLQCVRGQWILLHGNHRLTA